MSTSTSFPKAWIPPLPLDRTKFSPHFRNLCPSRTAATPTTIPRRKCPNMITNKSYQLQLVTVPDESHMTTPGEVRHVSLDYTLFQTILQTGSTTFGVLNIDDWSRRRGCVLSILNISNLSADVSPRVQVECRCSGRFDANIHSAPPPPPPWTLLTATCVPVSDWLVYQPADRQRLADTEWRVWKDCQQVAKLMRRVKTNRSRVLVEQQLAVWAPKEYDRKITPDEWNATPVLTRHVWCQRAESFSFGVLRCMLASEEIMARARAITNTVERLELALEAIELRRARTQAEISLRDAFS